MPNFNVYLLEGYSAEQQSTLLKGMTEVIVASLNAPPANVRIFLIELARAHVCVGGRLLSEADLPGGPTVQGFLVAGRSEAQKEALIAGLTQTICATLGVAPEPVRIMLVDVPNSDFGIGGRTARALGR